MEIKIRYTWRQIKTGEIKQRVEYLENLECGELLKEGVFMNPLWELISRDLWTGLKDENKNDIYENDEAEYDNWNSWSDLWESTSAVVKFINGEFYPVPNNSNITEYKIIGNTHINQIKEDTNG